MEQLACIFYEDIVHAVEQRRQPYQSPSRYLRSFSWPSSGFRAVERYSCTSRGGGGGGRGGMELLEVSFLSIYKYDICLRYDSAEKIGILLTCVTYVHCRLSTTQLAKCVDRRLLAQAILQCLYQPPFPTRRKFRGISALVRSTCTTDSNRARQMSGVSRIFAEIALYHRYSSPGGTRA